MGMKQFQISAYPLGELSALYHSSWWQASPYVPISTLRLHSYLNNPRADESDVVLYMALDNNNLVGFRTLLPDTMKTVGGKVKMAWLSGSWTHPEYRRRGISSALFEKAAENWQGKLAYSNYAPHSKKLYDQLNYTWNSVELKGTRHYHRFALSSILPGRSCLFQNSTHFLKGIDALLNVIVDSLNSRMPSPQLKFKITQQLEPGDEAFLSPYLEHQVFSRSVREFNWIQSNPWLTEDIRFKDEQEKYPFSLVASRFRSFFCRFLNDHDELKGLILVHIYNGFLCVPYAFMPQSLSNGFEDFLRSIIRKNNINISTLSKSKAQANLNLGAISKSYNRNFFFGSELIVPQYSNFNYGDGDAVFV